LLLFVILYSVKLMEMKGRIYFFLISLILIFSDKTNAQKFGGSINIGFNASQIDGDRLAGYDKVGFNVGIGSSYNLTSPWQLNIDFLFSQRGSQSKLIADKYEPIRKITLNYLELPVYLSYQDWYIDDEDYFKIQGFAGLSYGRLFSVKNRLNDPDYDELNFIKTDISYLLGAKYYFTKHWGINGRYTRSLFRMYKNPDDGSKSLLGYFLNFGIIYKIL